MKRRSRRAYQESDDNDPTNPQAANSTTADALPVPRTLPHNCDHDVDPTGGHSLGRDDPLWPRYLKEAEKWDDIMMEKWNR
jgi:hypothetical protein